MVVDPGFAVDAPPEAAWELERNRRWNGEPLVVFSHRGRSAGALSFRMLRVTDDSFGVPLEVLAEGYFFTSGAIDGVKANLTSTSHILVGKQPAVAVVGEWTIRPVTQRVAQVMLRGPDGLIVITVVAPPEHIEAMALELDQVLRHFELVSDQELDPFYLDTVPFSEPDHDPGHFGP